MDLAIRQRCTSAVYRLMLAFALLTTGHAHAQQPLPSYHPPELTEDVETQALTRAIGAKLTLLAPDHRGLAADPSLPLWLHTTDRIQGLNVQLWQGRTLVWQQAQQGIGPGLHRIALPNEAVPVKTGASYLWRLQLAGEEGGAATEASAAVRYIGPTTATDVLSLATKGIWYDAIDRLSNNIEHSPKQVQLRSQRASLLRQVGLGGLAQEDERYIPLQLRASLPATRFGSGDELWVTLSCAKPCYARIVQIDSQGKRQQIFPNEIQQGSLLPPGELIRLPAANSAIRLTVSPPFGKEALEVSAADKPFPVTEKSPTPARFGLPSTQLEQLRLDYVTVP
ncbi:DUF4384 domain-containing protein [Chitinilyticum aquatile]|uniref:DUF4384 domain-containing protein n=1 Tax=Chitinilyticum aquatile TaxID=362520 RepID=UPI000403BBE0|nr:DUF4384 domain-containing protein [Chitinilyticum aquatile]